jgi:hypothetical protein
MTPADLIGSAFQRAGIYGADRIVSAEDMQTGFECLNEMIDSWSVESLYLYQLVTQTLPSVTGQATYTLGPTGDFVGVRPTSIENVIYTDGSIDYTVVQMTQDQYDQIPYKAAAGIPSAFAYEPSLPLGVLSLYPVPSTGGTLNVQTAQQLTQFAAINTDIAFPPGYRAAIRQTLAVELCAEFSVTPSAALVGTATRAKRAVRRMNSRTPILDVPTGRAGTRNILSGFN